MRNIELTFREFLIAVLHRWKAILILGVIASILSGILSYSSQVQGADASQKTYLAQNNAYQANLASKTALVNYQTEISNSLKEYNENSLLMQVDPYNKKVTTLYISVEANPEVLYPELFTQSALGYSELRKSLIRNITERYLILAGSADLNSVFGSIIPNRIDETYLREIIQVNYFQPAIAPVGTNEAGINENVLLTINPETGLLTITAIGSINLDAKAVADAMYEYLAEKKQLVTESVSEHILRIVDESTANYIDTELAAFQSAKRNQVMDSTNQINKLLAEIQKLNASKPAAPPSRTSAIIQNSLLGFMLGLVLGLGLVLLLHLSTFPLRFALQMQNQLGFRFLGGVQFERKGLLFTRWKQTLTGESLYKNEAEAIALISANLEEAASGARRILVTGTLPEKTISEFSEKLLKEIKAEGMTLIPSKDIRINAQTVRDFAETDAVILVERLQVSRLKDVLEVKERIKMTGKPILGYVLY